MIHREQNTAMKISASTVVKRCRNRGPRDGRRTFGRKKVVAGPYAARN